jgi:hypothetical protein
MGKNKKQRTKVPQMRFSLIIPAYNEEKNKGKVKTAGMSNSQKSLMPSHKKIPQ